MQRIKELELRYKKYLLKKALKYAFLVVLTSVFVLAFKFGFETYEKQRLVLNKALQDKKDLEEKITKAQIQNEKYKISQEKLSKIEQEPFLETKPKFEISTQILSIDSLKKSFYKSPSYEKAINLAKMYLENKAYKKSIFWSLKANELDKSNKEAWLLFARAKRALGDEKEASLALSSYESFYDLEVKDE